MIASVRYVVLIFMCVCVIVATVFTVWNVRRPVHTSSPTRPLIDVNITSNGFRINQLHFPKRFQQYPFMNNGLYSFQNHKLPQQMVFDLRPKCPPVYNQGFYGDCTNQSSCFIVEYYCNNTLKRPFAPSRWFQNFYVQRFLNVTNESVIPLLLSVYGFPTRNGEAGGGFVETNMATMMMFGMVEENAFPFPTLDASEQHADTLQRLHKEFMALTTSNTQQTKKDTERTKEKLVSFINNSNQFINTLPLPSVALQQRALRHRVTKCIAINAHSIDDIRKCVYYKGPVAFDINLPAWFNVNQNSISYNTRVVQYVEDTIHGTLTENERVVLEYFPQWCELMRKESLHTWSSILLHKRLHKKIKALKWPHVMLDWQASVSYTFKNLLLKALSMDFKPCETLTAASRKKRATLHYPTEEIQKYVNILNKHNHLYSKTKKLQELSSLYNFWDIHIDGINKWIKTDPEIAEAIDFFNGLIVGGHSMSIVGFDDHEKMFVVRNSWGEHWGDRGYCYVSYDFFTHTLPLLSPKLPTMWLSQAMYGIGGVSLDTM